MPKDKRSFFERLTGSVSIDKEEDSDLYAKDELDNIDDSQDECGQIAVDVYQTNSDIIIKAMISGAKESDLDISITQDMITINGEREKKHEVNTEDYYYQELYWGSFSRSILLPQEVDVNAAEADVKDGILTIKLPKLDKDRIQKIKIKK